MHPKLERKLRKTSLEQLSALLVFAHASNPTVTTAKISDSTSTAENSLGGILSALSRTKIDGESIILPVGKDKNEGLRWRLNMNIAPRDELSKLLEDILADTNYKKGR